MFVLHFMPSETTNKQNQMLFFKSHLIFNVINSVICKYANNDRQDKNTTEMVPGLCSSDPCYTTQKGGLCARHPHDGVRTRTHQQEAMINGKIFRMHLSVLESSGGKK